MGERHDLANIKQVEIREDHMKKLLEAGLLPDPYCTTVTTSD